MQSRLDDILSTADHAVIDISQMPGKTGGPVLLFPDLLPLCPAGWAVTGSGTSEEVDPAGVAGSRAQGGRPGCGKAVLALRLLCAIGGENLAAGDTFFSPHGDN